MYSEVIPILLGAVVATLMVIMLMTKDGKNEDAGWDIRATIEKWRRMSAFRNILEKSINTLLVDANRYNKALLIDGSEIYRLDHYILEESVARGFVITKNETDAIHDVVSTKRGWYIGEKDQCPPARNPTIMRFWELPRTEVKSITKARFAEEILEAFLGA